MTDCTGQKHKEILVTKLMTKENNLINPEFKKGKWASKDGNEFGFIHYI